MSYSAGITASIVCLLIAHGVHAGSVTVTAEHVNLRAAPNAEAEVVAQADKGDVLAAQGPEEAGWIAVTPPDSASLWVYGELVPDGKVSTDRVKVRSGPGINYRTVGHIERGETVVVRETVREWVKIAPPPTCSLWVNRRYVSDSAASAARSDGTAAGQAVEAAADERQDVAAPVTADVSEPAQPPEPAVPAPAAEAPRVEAYIPPQPAVVDLPETDAQAATASSAAGSRVTYRGVLRPVGALVWRRPSDFRLVAHDGRRGPAETICYVSDDRRRLDASIGSEVEIVGREFRIQGVRHPLVVVEEYKVFRRVDDRW